MEAIDILSDVTWEWSSNAPSRCYGRQAETTRLQLPDPARSLSQPQAVSGLTALSVIHDGRRTAGPMNVSPAGSPRGETFPAGWCVPTRITFRSCCALLGALGTGRYRPTLRALAELMQQRGLPTGIERDSFLGFPRGKKSESMRAAGMGPWVLINDRWYNSRNTTARAVDLGPPPTNLNLVGDRLTRSKKPT